jgi:uncharacterized protein YegP (UPF0339 family)
MKARVYKGRDDLWYFRIIGDNGEIVAQSEAYRRRKDATDTANKIAASEFIVEVDLNNVTGP